MNIVEFPRSVGVDIPTGLRTLADEIERGDFGEIVRVVWITESVSGEIGVGLQGQCGEPGPTTFLLLALAQQRIMLGQD